MVSFNLYEVFLCSKLIWCSYVIPMVAFGFVGIESVAVTAYEARADQPNALRLPSQSIAYVTLFLYLLCMIGQVLNVPWTSDHLPPIYGGIGNSSSTGVFKDPASNSLTIIALWEWHMKEFAGVINGCMLFSVLSSANTALYVSSRTLYGIALRVPTTNPIGELLHKFSDIDSKTGIPGRALWLSAFIFSSWLPFMSLIKGNPGQYVSSRVWTTIKSLLICHS